MTCNFYSYQNCLECLENLASIQSLLGCKNSKYKPTPRCSTSPFASLGERLCNQPLSAEAFTAALTQCFIAFVSLAVLMWPKVLRHSVRPKGSPGATLIGRLPSDH
jgi:hypothetical protein